jgi:hypothetical protein
MNETLKSFRGIVSQVMGSMVIFLCLILFGVFLKGLNDSLSSIFSWEIGLPSIVPIFGLIIYLIFLFVGLSVVGVGDYLNLSDSINGDWVNKLLMIVSGVMSIIVSVIMYSMILAQLDVIYNL